MAVYAWRVTITDEPTSLFDADNTPEGVKKHLMVGRKLGLLWRVVTDEGEVLVGGPGVDDAEGFPWTQADGPFPVTTANHPWLVTETGEVDVAVYVEV